MSAVGRHDEEVPVRVAIFAMVALALSGSSASAQTGSKPGAPETFTANAQVAGAMGAAAATLQIAVQRYTPDAERAAVEAALKTGGFSGFMTALKKAPEVGSVEIGGRKYAIRYARETATPAGRTVVVVTDAPVFFSGGGAADAKPRAGYDVAVFRLEVDAIGLGSGLMAGAARVRPAPEGGVEVDDYGQQPVKLVTVTRKLS
jgi:hypothetical protein